MQAFLGVYYCLPNISKPHNKESSRLALSRRQLPVSGTLGTGLLYDFLGLSTACEFYNIKRMYTDTIQNPGWTALSLVLPDLNGKLWKTGRFCHRPGHRNTESYQISLPMGYSKINFRCLDTDSFYVYMHLFICLSISIIYIIMSISEEWVLDTGLSFSYCIDARYLRKNQGH